MSWKSDRKVLPPEFLRANQVAAMCSAGQTVSDERVWIWTRVGLTINGAVIKLRARRIPSGLAWAKEDVMAFLAAIDAAARAEAEGGSAGGAAGIRQGEAPGIGHRASAKEEYPPLRRRRAGGVGVVEDDEQRARFGAAAGALPGVRG